MKFIFNGADLTHLTRELTEFKGDILLSLNFLEKFADAGLKVLKTAEEFRIEADAKTILELLSPKNPFPANLELKLETDDKKKLKAKAELSLGNFGKASVDTTGKIEGSFKVF